MHCPFRPLPDTYPPAAACPPARRQVLAAPDAQGRLPKVALVPERHQPAEPRRSSWVDRLRRSRQEALAGMADRLGRERFSQPMTPEQVGQQLERSLGPDLRAFAGQQGTIKGIVETGERRRWWAGGRGLGSWLCVPEPHPRATTPGLGMLTRSIQTCSHTSPIFA